MTIQLEIHDGTPYWYLSTDIWVVPGSDPLAAAGSPVAGQPAYLWGRVTNAGSTDADGVRVDFYWANPALQVTRTNATLVGSAYVDVPAGDVQDVLCLVAWVPVIVNDGHECLVAVGNHPGDPLPSPLPDAFDPPSYTQVAQRNLTVSVVSAKAMTLALTIAALPREDKTVVVTIEAEKSAGKELLSALGLGHLKPARKGAVEMGLRTERSCPRDDEPLGEAKLELRLDKGTSAGVYVSVRAGSLRKGEYQLVHVAERRGDDLLGGLGLVLVSEDMEAGS